MVRKSSFLHIVLAFACALVLGLAFTGNSGSNVHAQSVYQKIPRIYRGTWHRRYTVFNHKRKHASRAKMRITARSFSYPYMHVRGRKLGWHYAKHGIYVFQINKHGQQISQSTFIRKPYRHHHKKMVKVYTDVWYDVYSN